jgi:hypothetical protein
METDDDFLAAILQFLVENEGENFRKLYHVKLTKKGKRDSQALPAHRPNVAGIMPGGKPSKPAGRYPKGMKTLPNPWKAKPKRKGRLGRLMG